MTNSLAKYTSLHHPTQEIEISFDSLNFHLQHQLFRASIPLPSLAVLVQVAHCRKVSALPVILPYFELMNKYSGLFRETDRLSRMPGVYRCDR